MKRCAQKLIDKIVCFNFNLKKKKMGIMFKNSNSFRTYRKVKKIKIKIEDSGLNL